MTKAMLLAAAVLVAMTWGLIAPVTADQTTEREGRLQHLQMKPGKDAMPAPDELKVNAGSVAGHKTPVEVLVKAIAAAKAGKLAEVKACFEKGDQENLDSTTYYKGKESTQIKVIANHLSKLDPEALTQVAQGKMGHYAVVVASVDGGQRMIRLTFKSKNWYLQDAYSDNYGIDYSSGVGRISKAIAGSDLAAIKAALPDEATSMLDFLSGVEDGVDPYALLAKRLKKISTGGSRPHILLNSWMSAAVFWFHGESGDTFLALTYQMDFSNFRNPVYRAKLNLPLMAKFLKDPAQAHKEFTSDYKRW